MFCSNSRFKLLQAPLDFTTANHRDPGEGTITVVASSSEAVGRLARVVFTARPRTIADVVDLQTMGCETGDGVGEHA
jgi:hypothetical protein